MTITRTHHAAPSLQRTFRRTRALAAAVLVLCLVAPGALAASKPIPTSLDLYAASGFRYQDPNPYACTSTSAMDMLNFVALRRTGGIGFRWTVTLSGAKRDSMLEWERSHDTLKGGNGSDPHGWRNALNHYGWGAATLQQGQRVYDDRSYDAYSTAMRDAVRQLIRTRKPVGILARRGQHAQIMTGYYGLAGDPMKKRADGSWANDFTVGGFYISDPLRSAGIVDRQVSWSGLQTTSNLGLRLQRYYETDSPYDDPYTPGVKPAKDEWYGLYVLIVPIR